jgi:hypothetical protein
MFASSVRPVKRNTKTICQCKNESVTQIPGAGESKQTAEEKIDEEGKKKNDVEEGQKGGLIP